MRRGYVILVIFVFFVIIQVILYRLWGTNPLIYSSYHIVIIILQVINFLITVGISINLLLKNENSSNKAIWLFTMLLLPYIGVIIYITFARDFKNRFILAERPLIKDHSYLLFEPETDIDESSQDIFYFSHRISHKAIYQNDSKTTILTNGDEFFPKLMEQLKLAEHSIYMAYYIVRDDEISRQIMSILIEKVKAGVDVRFIYDIYGIRRVSFRKLRKYRKAGIKMVAYEKFRWTHLLNAINFRYHRKLTIIDGRIGFIGGMNLGDEYYHRNKRFGFWRDTQVLVEGHAIVSLMNIFLKDWYYATGEWLEPKYFYSQMLEQGRTMVLESGPDYNEPIIKQIYFKMISEAKKSIKITTPYLMLEPDLLSCFISASKSGVEVSFLLPGKPDKFWVNQGTKSYYDVLLRNGINVYEYNKVFVHAKVLIVDDKIASVGSVNFDPRSFNINFEATALIENEAVNKLVEDFQNDLANSNKIELSVWRKRSFFKKLLQGFTNLFSAFL